MITINHADHIPSSMSFLGYKIDDDYSAYLGIKTNCKGRRPAIFPKNTGETYIPFTIWQPQDSFFIGSCWRKNITSALSINATILYLKKIYGKTSLHLSYAKGFWVCYHKHFASIYVRCRRIILYVKKNGKKDNHYSECEKQSLLTKRNCFFQNMRYQGRIGMNHGDYIYYVKGKKYNIIKTCFQIATCLCINE